MHVLVGVGWNGVAFAQLVLASTAAADAGLRHSAYELMHVVDRVLDIPLALLTLVTGVVISVKTRWGLLRHWWVATKLVITVVAVILGGSVMRPLIVRAGQATDGGEVAYTAPTVAIVLGASVMNVLFITATVLSIAKPWGKTPRGRRAMPRAGAAPIPTQPGPPAPSAALATATAATASTGSGDPVLPATVAVPLGP
ncbi:hypothetical protein [Frankia sp. CcWB3]